MATTFSNLPTTMNGLLPGGVPDMNAIQNMLPFNPQLAMPGGMPFPLLPFGFPGFNPSTFPMPGYQFPAASAPNSLVTNSASLPTLPHVKREPGVEPVPALASAGGTGRDSLAVLASAVSTVETTGLASSAPASASSAEAVSPDGSGRPRGGRSQRLSPVVEPAPTIDAEMEPHDETGQDDPNDSDYEDSSSSPSSRTSARRRAASSSSSAAAASSGRRGRAKKDGSSAQGGGASSPGEASYDGGLDASADLSLDGELDGRSCKASSNGKSAARKGRPPKHAQSGSRSPSPSSASRRRNNHRINETRRRLRLRDKFAELQALADGKCAKKDMYSVLSWAVRQLEAYKSRVHELEAKGGFPHSSPVVITEFSAAAGSSSSSSAASYGSKRPASDDGDSPMEDEDSRASRNAGSGGRRKRTRAVFDGPNTQQQEHTSSEDSGRQAKKARGEETDLSSSSASAAASDASSPSVPLLAPVSSSVPAAPSSLDQPPLNALAAAYIAVNGKVMDANTPLATLLGHSRSQIVNASLFGLLHADDVTNVFAAIKLLIGGQASNWVGEQRFVDGKGRSLPAHLTLTPVMDVDKKDDAASMGVRAVKHFMLIVTPRGALAS